MIYATRLGYKSFFSTNYGDKNVVNHRNNWPRTVSHALCAILFTYTILLTPVRAHRSLHDIAIKFSNTSSENRSEKIPFSLCLRYLVMLNRALSVRRRANELRAISSLIFLSQCFILSVREIYQFATNTQIRRIRQISSRLNYNNYF